MIELNMWIGIAFLIGACIIGVIIGTIIARLRYFKKAPYAGEILVDLNRDAEDTISISNPRNISQWKKFKKLTFDVVVKF